MNADLGRAAPGWQSREPLSIDFVNTRYAVRGRIRDGIETPARLLAWLNEHADTWTSVDAGTGVPEQVGPAEVESFRALRETISSLFRAAVEHRVGTPAELAQLNETALIAPSAPALVTDGAGYRVVERSCDTGLPVVRGAIARDAVYLLGGTSDGDVRACHGPGCVLLFVTTDSRRRWCSPACGNRARAARHYHRHRDG